VESQEVDFGTCTDLLIDLEKAALAKHADYMFPLMRAINDCLLFTKHGNGSLLREDPHLGAFVDRLCQAGMYEALHSFAEKVIPKAENPPKEIYLYLTKDSDVANALSKLKKYAHDEKMMRKYKSVRDQMVFHYDVEKQYTRDTLQKLAAYARSETDIGKLQPIVRTAPLAAVARYFCADTFMKVVWSDLHKQVTFEAEDSEAAISIVPTVDYQEEFIGFASSAIQEFVEFGVIAIGYWLVDQKLIKEGRSSKIVGKRKESSD
jgi:hypothetical protein